MQTENSNVELIDKFIVNEKRSKTWALVSTGLFVMMALLVLYFSFKLNKVNKDLDIANKRLDTLNSILQQRAYSDSVNAVRLLNNNDSLTASSEVMTILFNKTQEKLSGNDLKKANDQITQLANTVLPQNDRKIVESVKAAILDPKKDNHKAQGDFLVFLQCMPNFMDKTQKLRSLLRQNHFKAEEVQKIVAFSFDPSVKYFNDDDKASAMAILKLINGSDPYFAQHPAKLAKLDSKSPYHQVEVWIGAYEKMDTDQILQNSRANKLLKSN